MLCPWWHSTIRGFDFELRANPARSWALLPSAECKGGLEHVSTLSDEQYLARSDSNLHLLFALRDILKFLANCYGITDYWETFTFKKSCCHQIVFPFLQNKQFSFWLQLNSQDLCLHCWKVSEHCTVLCELNHTKNLHVALSAMRHVIIFLVFQKGGRGLKRIFQGYELSALRGWKTWKLLLPSFYLI